MKNERTVKKTPRIYSIHSQKGGVGKTTIALAIAGIEAKFSDKKVLMIDNDLTGTSFIDVLEREDENKGIHYFNNLIMANPSEFNSYTSKTGKKIDRQMNLFYKKHKNITNIYFVAGSPILRDIFRIVPLISQEDHLHFFRQRLEDIIVTALTIDNFDVIIIDNPPGLFGVSKASLLLLIDEMLWNIKSESEKQLDIDERTRLNKLYKATIIDNRKAYIETQVVFVTTTDKVDFKALLPSFSSIIKDKYPSLFENKGNSNQNMDSDSLVERLNLIINKAYAKEGQRFNPVFITKELFDNCKNFPDEREVASNIEDIFVERAKKKGAIACKYFKGNESLLERILPYIERIKTLKKTAIDSKEFSPINEWLFQIINSINISFNQNDKNKIK